MTGPVIAGLESHWVDLYRPTFTEGGQGDDRRSLPALGSPTAAGIGLCMQEMTPGRAQQLFGVKTEIRYSATVIAGADVQREDILRIVDGASDIGKDFLVLDQKFNGRCVTKMIFLAQTNDGPS